MARVKGGATTRRRHKKVLKLAKGYYGAKHTLYRTANEQVMRSQRYAYRDRKQLKREMRKLWIQRINAAARLNGTTYSTLMHGLRCADIQINRKMLSEMAIHDPEGFSDLVKVALEAGSKAKAAAPKAVVKEVVIMDDEQEEVKEAKVEEPVVKEVVVMDDAVVVDDIAAYGSTWVEVVGNIIKKHCAQEFSFDDLLEHQDIAQQAYPKNKNVAGALRTNLNTLVAEGKIEDLGDDNFKQA